MVAKCGRLVVWHWAHVQNEGCDAYALEGEWHLAWKDRLASAGARIEVLQRKGDECHIADVVLPSGQVLELAGTYHPANVIAARETFYGKRMNWLYRAEDFIERVEFHAPEPDRQLFRFKQAPRSMVAHKRWPLFWEENGLVQAIGRLWRFKAGTYGEWLSEGSIDEFVGFAIKEM